MFATRKGHGRLIEHCTRTLDIAALTWVADLLLDDCLEQGARILPTFEAGEAQTTHLLIGPEVFITLVDSISMHLLCPDLSCALPPPFGPIHNARYRILPYAIRRATSRHCWRIDRSFNNALVPRSRLDRLHCSIQNDVREYNKVKARETRTQGNSHYRASIPQEDYIGSSSVMASWW